jgi:hypothetical protein
MEGATLTNLNRHAVEQSRQVGGPYNRLGGQEGQAGKGGPVNVRHLPNQRLACVRLVLAHIRKDTGARDKRGQQSPRRDQQWTACQHQPVIEEQAAVPVAVQG